MNSIECLEPAIDPNNRISFLLDWEITLKCNLDCSYCGPGHDNSTAHPPLDQCLQTIDFMFEYVDLYMSTRIKGLKYVILNVYGGESLHHPNIVAILKEVRNRYQKYKDRWNLVITTTTNAVVPPRKLLQLIDLIDEFTVTYHTETTKKQKDQILSNIILIRDSGKRVKCVVLMHLKEKNFAEGESVIKWLTENNVKLLPRQLDQDLGVHDLLVRKPVMHYSQTQIKWFNTFYSSQTFNKNFAKLDEQTEVSLSEVGRACCGGRQVCSNQNYQSREFFVQNQFKSWFCTVNHFFLYVKQVTGEIFTNKDCRMNFNGTTGPIGHLNNTTKLLEQTKSKVKDASSFIQCKKNFCYCGLCAPKATELAKLSKIMEKYTAK